MNTTITSRLESTGEPLWFNNAFIEYKGGEDDSYIVPEGWGLFSNQLCVEIPSRGRNGMGYLLMCMRANIILCRRRTFDM